MTRAEEWSLRTLLADNDGRRSGAAIATAVERIVATDAAIRAWEWRSDPIPGMPDSGPLAGVPFGVKDIIDLAGAPTRCGSELNRDAPPANADATIVSTWRRLGAVPVGKTVTTEYAYFGPGVTRNPHDIARTPGGSSSGSAAAVAAGQVPLAIGTQTAGSVTRPAAFCGVAALVLTTGTLPTDGVTGLSESLDTHGFFTATVDDLAVAYDALAGTATHPRRRPPRIAVWDPAAVADLEPAMAAGITRAHSALLAAGAELDALDPLAPAAATRSHPIVMGYEAARERAELLPHLDRLSPPLASLLSGGAQIESADYERARDTIAGAGATVGEALDEYDAILAPAALGAAPVGLGATGDPVLSRAWQGLGLPVVVIPALRDECGMPLGLQVVGARRGESELLSVAIWIEQILLGGARKAR